MNTEFNGKYNQTFEWYGIYRGISWSIRGRKPCIDKYRDLDFCHYLLINLEQIPESVREEFWLKPKASEFSVSKRKYVSYDYYDSPLGNLEWHGGITFYEKRGGFDSDDRLVKAGCDYMHLWDEGQHFSLSYVISETKQTIDSLHQQVPGILIQCGHGYCGKPFHLESEGVYFNPEEKTNFICFFCEGKRQKELKERVEVIS